jgi:hypothetical protein
VEKVYSGSLWLKDAGAEVIKMEEKMADLERKVNHRCEMNFIFPTRFECSFRFGESSELWAVFNEISDFVSMFLNSHFSLDVTANDQPKSSDLATRVEKIEQQLQKLKVMMSKV